MVRANRDLRHSLYWRSRRKLPTGRHRGHLPGHMSPPGAQGAGGELVAPDRVARPQNLQQVYADTNEVQGGRKSKGMTGFLSASAISEISQGSIRQRSAFQ